MRLKGEILNISPLLLNCVRAAVGIAYLCLLSSCAGVHFNKDTSTAEDKKVLIGKVPFVKQKTDYCGPASLAMVLGFWGAQLTQDEIAGEIYSPELKGTVSIELLLYAIQKGFWAEMYNGSFQDLREKIISGFPLIVSNRTDKGNERVHYLVIWGFDDNAQKIYVHSGTKEGLAMDYQTFLERWSWADKLTLFIHPIHHKNSD